MQAGLHAIGWALPRLAIVLGVIVFVPIVLIVCGPVVGLLLERVFRPLQRRRASSSERLVAAVGVTIALLGLISKVIPRGTQPFCRIVLQ